MPRRWKRGGETEYRHRPFCYVNRIILKQWARYRIRFQQLDLSRSDIQDEDISMLEYTRVCLKYLRLPHTKVTDNALTIIARSFPSLKFLDISFTSITGSPGHQIEPPPQQTTPSVRPARPQTQRAQPPRKKREIIFSESTPVTTANPYSLIAGEEEEEEGEKEEEEVQVRRRRNKRKPQPTQRSKPQQPQHPHPPQPDEEEVENGWPHLIVPQLKTLAIQGLEVPQSVIAQWTSLAPFLTELRVSVITAGNSHTLRLLAQCFPRLRRLVLYGHGTQLMHPNTLYHVAWFKELEELILLDLVLVFFAEANWKDPKEAPFFKERAKDIEALLGTDALPDWVPRVVKPNSVEHYTHYYDYETGFFHPLVAGMRKCRQLRRLHLECSGYDLTPEAAHSEGRWRSASYEALDALWDDVRALEESIPEAKERLAQETLRVNSGIEEYEAKIKELKAGLNKPHLKIESTNQSFAEKIKATRRETKLAIKRLKQKALDEAEERERKALEAVEEEEEEEEEVDDTMGSLFDDEGVEEYEDVAPIEEEVDEEEIAFEKLKRDIQAEREQRDAWIDKLSAKKARVADKAAKETLRVQEEVDSLHAKIKELQAALQVAQNSFDALQAQLEQIQREDPPEERLPWFSSGDFEEGMKMLPRYVRILGVHNPRQSCMAGVRLQDYNALETLHLCDSRSVGFGHPCTALYVLNKWLNQPVLDPTRGRSRTVHLAYSVLDEAKHQAKRLGPHVDDIKDVAELLLVADSIPGYQTTTEEERVRLKELKTLDVCEFCSSKGQGFFTDTDTINSCTLFISDFGRKL